MKIIKSFIAVLLVTISTSTFATGLFFEGGLHLGGDTLIEVVLTNGETEKVKAGQLLSLAVGVHTDISDSLQGRLSLGYKFDFITADNGDIEFTRIPIEFLLMQQSGSWMFGGGVSYHLSPKLTADAPVIGLVGTVNLDDALGFVIAFDYNTQGIFESAWYMGGRITIIDYENQFGSVSGNSVGVVFGYLY
jgi:hypothetical protein